MLNKFFMFADLALGAGVWYLTRSLRRQNPFVQLGAWMTITACLVAAFVWAIVNTFAA